MTSLILTAQTLNFINKIGIETIITMISTSTTSITNIFSYITRLDNNKNNYNLTTIKQDIINLDLEFIISVISQLIKEQTLNNSKESIKHALIGVNNILLEINRELLIIKESIDYHYKKYFSSMRSLDCNISMNLLKQHKLILSSRYKILSNLLQIYKN
jgi:hypothetical protein